MDLSQNKVSGQRTKLKNGRSKLTVSAQGSTRAHCVGSKALLIGLKNW